MIISRLEILHSTYVPVLDFFRCVQHWTYLEMRWFWLSLLGLVSLLCLFCIGFKRRHLRQHQQQPYCLQLHASTSTSVVMSKTRRYSSEREMNDWAKLASKISQAKQKEATEDKRGRIRVSSGSIDGNRNHVQV